jgi:hypothetical protein
LRQRAQASAGGYGAAVGHATASPQIICNASSCRPVQRGCHLEYRGGGGPGNEANVEVCH